MKDQNLLFNNPTPLGVLARRVIVRPFFYKKDTHYEHIRTKALQSISSTSRPV